MFMFAGPAAAGGGDLSGPYAPIWMPIKFIGIETLHDMLGEEDLVVADVRYFAPLDEGKIPGAVRYHPFDVENWGKTIPEDAKIVIY
jgi:rhodanese-related sulfurtransferase